MHFLLRTGLGQRRVDFLLRLFEKVLKKEIKEIHQESIKIKFIGDLSPFPDSLKSILYRSEAITKDNKNFTLNVCVNYGGRQEMSKLRRN